MEEDRGGSARENEGRLCEAREVDPRGNAEEEEVNGMECLRQQTKEMEWQMANMQARGEEETYIWVIITGSSKQSNKMKVINNHTEECVATA